MKKVVAIICTIVIFAFSLIGCGDKDTVAYNLKLNEDGRYGGLLYDTQMFRTLRTGDRVKGYISQVRPDVR